MIKSRILLFFVVMLAVSACVQLPRAPTGDSEAGRIGFPKSVPILDAADPNEATVLGCIGYLVEYDKESDRWKNTGKRYLAATPVSAKTTSQPTKFRTTNTDSKAIRSFLGGFESGGVYIDSYQHTVTFSADANGLITDTKARMENKKDLESKTKFALVSQASLVEVRHEVIKGTKNISEIKASGWVQDGYFFNESGSTTARQHSAVTLTLIRLN